MGFEDAKADLKRAGREMDETAKETWRKADGEDLGDKVANAGDETRKHLGNAGDAGDAAETEALRRAVLGQFEQYVKLNKKIPQEILTSLTGIDDAGRLADTIAAHLPLKLEQKQGMLETPKALERLEGLLSQLEGEIDILQVEKRIRGRVKKQMEKSQRDYYLNEQVKAIQKELGEGEDGADVEELEKRIEQAQLSKEALKKAESEMKKLKLMSPMSAEATVVRNYIETLVGLPWRKKSRINNSLSNAEEVLDADHFGLERSRNVLSSTWLFSNVSTN